jgi:hypothetical protein
MQPLVRILASALSCRKASVKRRPVAAPTDAILALTAILRHDKCEFAQFGYLTVRNSCIKGVSVLKDSSVAAVRRGTK